MPVLHSYVNDDGYYVSARPPDVGNITYQVSEEAEELIKQLGYADDDDLPWGVINPLISAGLVYTEGQGAGQGDSDAPRLNPSELPEMTESEIQELLDYLRSREDVPERVLRLLKEKSSQRKNAANKMAKQIDGIFPDESTLVDITWDSKGIESKVDCIEIELTRKNIIHTVSLSERPSGFVVDEWYIRHPKKDTWDEVAEVSESLPKIMNAFSDINSETSLEIERPRNETVRYTMLSHISYKLETIAGSFEDNGDG